MNALERVYAAIKKAPKGITSSAICDANPDLQRATVTSAVSKLKNKGLIRYDAQVSNKPILLYPLEAKPTATPQPKAPAVKEQPKQSKPNLSVELRAKIIEVLQPFADYSKTIRENTPQGEYVIFSATTTVPTVQIAKIEYFRNAQILLEELQA